MDFQPLDPDSIEFTVYYEDGQSIPFAAERCEYRLDGWGNYEYALFGIKGDADRVYIDAAHVVKVEPEDKVEETFLTPDMLRNWSIKARN